MIYIVTYLLFHLGLINLKIMNYKYILDRHQEWRSHDPMSIQTFDFCGLFILHLFCTNSSNFVQTSTNLAQLGSNSAQFCLAQLDLVQLGLTRPNATRPNTTRLNSTRLDSRVAHFAKVCPIFKF